ncbi:sulfur oxidation c-type cytochrome SoxA [Roseibacterium sp. SDUM158016]|uniref:sulfur oxidation c-type cytochrome SoxA n=1 Tax=Roseicyclus sediminis TaxID=2980997 RepID=UPI0021CEEEBD|nr:sulfur oxidation c-type cytochrome SoxA [Roseibacterium sp. SDUM158016]MCU4651410.1 sulfur oxidation c-type cytochrome SoxA [Roseibacterium sp. SDUM158016]
MRKTSLFGGAAVAAVAIALAGATSADIGDDEELIVNGEIEMIIETAAPEHLQDRLSTIYSGWVFRSDETQAMQADDFDNPGMIFVDQGLEAFETVMGTEGQSCASCHENAESLSEVRSTYPKWDEERGLVQTVEMQIIECQTERMGAEPYGYDSQDMRNMTALISSVGRGIPVNVAIDGPAQETWEQGREIYYTRFGQLELSCANCHEDNYGNLIRADHLSQGQINGFPTYRLRNAGLVSIHNRFRGCIRDTRGETFSVGSPEFVALELYVASRGNGLTVEGPSVRN